MTLPGSEYRVGVDVGGTLTDIALHERVHGHAVETPARFVNVRAVHRQRMPHRAGATVTGTTDVPGGPDTNESGGTCSRAVHGGGFDGTGPERRITR